MSELQNYIKSYFGVVNEVELEIISHYFKRKTLKKGVFFLETNRQANQLSFVQEGILRIFVHTEEKEVTQWISTKGSFITDLSSFMFDTPARWNIQALSDVELFSINKEDYKALGKQIPQWQELEKLFLAKCFIFLEDRVFSHLSMTAEERYEFFYGQNRELFNQVPLQYIASMLGMTPETLSRIRKKQIS